MTVAPEDLDLAAASLAGQLADSVLERHRRAAAVLESLCRAHKTDPPELSEDAESAGQE